MTVEEYLLRHAVLDGHGNMDGHFVPLSVAMIAVQQTLAGKLDPQPPSWIKKDETSRRSAKNC